MSLTPEKLKEQEAEFAEMRTRLPDGPWMQEPDRVEFKEQGYDCLIQRNSRMGVLCGYVAVPETHPDFGKKYDEVDVSVHGGLTYSEACQGTICHITEGEDRVWWFGFDCGHYKDVVPQHLVAGKDGRDKFYELVDCLLNDMGAGPAEYRTIDYAQQEILTLAAQLKERETNAIP